MFIVHVMWFPRNIKKYLSNVRVCLRVKLVGNNLFMCFRVFDDEEGKLFLTRHLLCLPLFNRL